MNNFFVLLSIHFFARRVDLLWGRLSTCGGLSIRLPQVALSRHAGQSSLWGSQSWLQPALLACSKSAVSHE
jgi:hypothetical protein